MKPASARGAGVGYSKYFEIVPALTDAYRDAVYRIRHRVYCEELGYEPAHADGRERDEHDEHAVHVLIRSVQSGAFIGCTRIIQPSAADPARLLPFELACRHALDRAIVDPARLDRLAIGEVSRLAVVGEFRRRKGEQALPMPLSSADFGTAQQPRFPYIPVGLYLATIELARLRGIETLFMLTERRLASHFAKLGVRVRTIGAPVEHRGTRVPSMMHTHEVIAGLRPLFRPLYRAIAADLAKGL